MITGGFGDGGQSAPASPPAYESAFAQQQPLSTPTPAVMQFAPNAVTPLSSYASSDEGVIETANYETEGEGLLGETRAAPQPARQAPAAATPSTSDDEAWRALDRYQADVTQALNRNQTSYAAPARADPVPADDATQVETKAPDKSAYAG